VSPGLRIGIGSEDMVSNRSNGSTGASAPEAETPPPEAFDHLLKQVSELWEYAIYFISAKTDSVKLSVRQVIMWAALGVVGMIALGSVVATAVVLLLTGVGEGLAVAFGGRMWLGDIVAGVLTLGLLGLGSWVGMQKWRKSSRMRTIQHYEQQQLQQQAAFGRSVSDRAADIQR
jgi:hypothetical protein